MFVVKVQAMTIAIVSAGSITGTVRFVNSPPNLAPVKVSKDQDYCGETLPNETYLIDPNGGQKCRSLPRSPTGHRS